MKQEQSKVKITPSMSVSELIESYPILEKVLLYEFGIVCANCPMQGYDSLEEAARYHMIEGEDFEEMIEILEEYINKETVRIEKSQDK